MPLPETKIRVSGATALPAYVAGNGGSAARVLDAADVVAAELRDADAWLPLGRMALLYESSAAELNDPYFGIAFGRTLPLQSYGLLSYVVLNAGDVATALENLARYTERLSVSGADVELVVDGPIARLLLTLRTGDVDACRQYVEATVAVLCVMMGALVGDDWRARDEYLDERVRDRR